jgi:hypothetical protein
MDEETGTHLLLPLPLAELLYVMLGPLVEVLKTEGHPWAGLAGAVINAYREGRDKTLHKMYGEHVVRDIDIVTFLVSEELAKWADEISEMQTDFKMWREELNGNEGH